MTKIQLTCIRVNYYPVLLFLLPETGIVELILTSDMFTNLGKVDTCDAYPRAVAFI